MDRVGENGQGAIGLRKERKSGPAKENENIGRSRGWSLELHVMGSRWAETKHRVVLHVTRP